MHQRLHSVALAKACCLNTRNVSNRITAKRNSTSKLFVLLQIRNKFETNFCRGNHSYYAPDTVNHLFVHPVKVTSIGYHCRAKWISFFHQTWINIRTYVRVNRNVQYCVELSIRIVTLSWFTTISIYDL